MTVNVVNIFIKKITLRNMANVGPMDWHSM